MSHRQGRGAARGAAERAANMADAAAASARDGQRGAEQQDGGGRAEPKTLWGNSEPWPPAAGAAGQSSTETLGFYESDRSGRKERSLSDLSLLRFISAELTRGYFLEHNEAKYTERRERVYTCMRIPKELEKLMFFGIFLCLDAFLYVFTLLPLRVFLAMFRFITLPCYGLRSFPYFHGRLCPEVPCVKYPFLQRTLKSDWMGLIRTILRSFRT